MAAHTVHHLGQLCLRNHTGTVQVIHRAEARLRVIVEVPKRVIAVDRPDNTPENTVANRLSQFHGLLRLVLRLHLLLVESRKRLCRVRHSLIGNERHTGMLHAVHLLGCETELGRVLPQIAHVCTIGIVTGCQLTGHRPAVAAQHHAVIAHYRHALQGSLVILTRNTPCMFLGVAVALIVAVVHTAAVGVHRETVCLLPCLGVVARG